MFKIALRKMAKNKWLVICLFLGCFLAVALMASIPTYSQAVLQRMITRGYTDVEAETGKPGLHYSVEFRPLALETEYHSLEETGPRANGEYFAALGLPATRQRVTMAIPSVSYRHVALAGGDAATSQSSCYVAAIDGMEDYAELVAGRLPATAAVNGEYEVMVTQATMDLRRLMLGSRYRATQLADGSGQPIVFRVVGVFREQDVTDDFWFGGASTNYFYLNSNAFTELGESLNAASKRSYLYRWDYALDYTQLDAESAETFLAAAEAQLAAPRSSGFSVSFTNLSVLRDFQQQKAEVTLFLWVLQVPVIALLAFFIIMISTLIFEHDRAEVALMRSRGAGKGKILLIYVYQSLIISALAFAAGIPASLWLCRFIGSSNGFLEFVGRAPLPVQLRWQSWLYALGGVAVFLASMLGPILFSRGGSIVSTKRKRSARNYKPFYEKLYLDVILLAAALYGKFSYDATPEAFSSGSGASAMNPALFLITVLFLFGSALLFTRLYPLLVRLVFRIGHRRWPPALYAALTSASRARSRHRMLMVFLILTVSLGIFDSAAARTINQNREDRIGYEVGANIRLQENWRSIDPDPQYGEEGLVEKPVEDLYYVEPFFDKFTALEGVEAATRVYRNDRGRLLAHGQWLEEVDVIAIEPATFATVSWRRSDIYPYHLNYLMNALITAPNSVILSTQLAQELGLAHGDTLEIGWRNNTHMLNCVVYDAIDFFPTYNAEVLDEEEEKETLTGAAVKPAATAEEPDYFVIMNYALVRDSFRLEPYEVWLSHKQGYTNADIFRQMAAEGIVAKVLYDDASRIVDLKNQPLIQGMNGTLTLSFLITIAITITGFLIFWVFDLQGRQLQLGIMRSLGMTKGGIAALLVWEQLLLSILPIFAGLLIGTLSVALYVPMFGFGAAGYGFVPPFRIFSLPADYLRIGGIVLLAVLVAVLFLTRVASRLRISQTLKLGED